MSDDFHSEQKQHDLASVWELLHKVDKNLSVHISQYNEDLPKIKELIKLLDRSKGVLIFLTWIAAIGASVIAMLAWAKSHITL